MKIDIKLRVFLMICLLICGCKPKSIPTEPKLPPAIPILQSPLNNAIEVKIPVTLSWYTSSNALSYGLQVSTDSQFVNKVYDTSGIQSTFMKISGLDYSTIYYWRVNATNDNGTSFWSTPVWSFKTDVMPCPGTPTVEYGGKVYHTVQIGSQCWLKENLDIGIMKELSDTLKDNGVIEKHCYDDNPVNCTGRGGLYVWDEAMQYTASPGARGICPLGWHIPTRIEFDTLRLKVNENGNVLKAVGQGVPPGGEGTNTSGFSALLGGRSNSIWGYSDWSEAAYYWSSTELDWSDAYEMRLKSSSGQILLTDILKFSGLSIRCLKD